MQNNHSFDKFINIHTATSAEKSQLKHHFLSQLNEVLLALKVDDNYTTSIGECLYASMITPWVTYHTPIHTMNMFTFTNEHKIELSNEELLAIFFHDAIYRPGSKVNEANSSLFMESLLVDTGISTNSLTLASNIIKDTAYHISGEIQKESELVMDIDVSGFAATPGQFAFQSKLIEYEFQRSPHRSDEIVYSLEQFLTGRLAFLEKLKSKKSLYRTPFFMSKFEKKAQLNISNAISEVKTRIENEL